MLKFQPELRHVLRSRVKRAVTPAYDVTTAQRDPSSRPGAKREHVFDFYSGARVILSRDYDPASDHEPRPMLHASMSWHGMRGPYFNFELELRLALESLGLSLDGTILAHGRVPFGLAYHVLFTPEYTSQLCEELGILTGDSHAGEQVDG